MTSDYAQLYSIQTVDFDAIVESFKMDSVAAGVISGGDATVSVLTVTVAASVIRLTTGITTKIASTAVAVTADATNPKKYLIVVDSAGAIQLRSGTAEAASPVGDVRRFAIKPAPPELTVGDIVLYEVWVTAGATSITSTDVSDRRVTVLGAVPTEKMNWYDDFIGDSLDARWTPTTSGTGTVAILTGLNGLVNFVTGATINSTSRINFGAFFVFERGNSAIIKFRMRTGTTTSLTFFAGFASTDFLPGSGGSPVASSALVRFDSGGSGTDTNFMLVTSDGTTSSATSSGVAIDSVNHDFIIELRSGDVRLWMDGVLKVTKTTNLPLTATDLAPYFGVTQDAGASRTIVVDYVHATQDR